MHGMQGRGTQCDLLSMQRDCALATEGRGCRAWSSFHVLILKEEDGYRAHEEAVGDGERCNCISVHLALPLQSSLSQLLTEFLIFFYPETILGWIIGLIVVECTLPPFNFGFIVWVFSGQSNVSWGFRSACIARFTLCDHNESMPKSVIPAWLQSEKCGADLNETYSLDQDQLIYILKPTSFSWPRSAEWQSIYRARVDIVSHRIWGRGLIYSIIVAIANWCRVLT